MFLSGKTWRLTLLLMISQAAVGLADSPRIASTTPRHGDGSVEASVAEIKITFDQPMQENQSWVETAAMPEVTGTRWVNDRTTVLSVKLQAGREYLLQLNGLGAYGFQNQDGERLKPVVLSFATASTDGSETPRGLSVAQNRAAAEELKSVIDQRYSYRDRVIKDWSQHFADYDSWLAHSRDPVAFASATAALLATAEDCHVDVFCEARGFASFRVRYRTNCNPEILPKLIPHFKFHSASMSTGQFEDGIGYMAINNLTSHRVLDFVMPLMKATRGGRLILDLRRNNGGSEPLAKWIAGCFMSKRKVYGRHRTRDPAAKEGFVTGTRTLGPTIPGPRIRCRKVAVLMGKRNMSSCESFLLMMRQVPNCRLFGETSRGSSGNPKHYHLSNGVSVRLPTWWAMDAAGNDIEGIGVQPDVVIAPEDFQETDAVLEAALRWLGE